MLGYSSFSSKCLFRPLIGSYKNYRKKASLKRGLTHQDGTHLPILSKEQKKEIDLWYEKYGLILNDYYFHRWYYEVTGVFSPSCIPERVMNSQILNKFNDSRLSIAWADKAYYDRRFSSKCIETPYTVLRNINGIFYDNNYKRLDLDQAALLVGKEETVITKPTIDSGKGKNIRIYSSNEGLRSIIRDYSSNYLVQRIVEQHDSLSKLNADSVNTFRVMTWCSDGNVYVIAAMLRVGIPGSVVDNISAGGYGFRISSEGCLSGPARNKGGRIVKTPETVIGERYIFAEHYKKIVSSLKELHNELPYFGIVAWDITIDKNGSPVLIEYNLQTPGLHLFQALCGTFEGEVPDKLLQEAKKRDAL
mgnify:CR=1 FL=1